MQKQGLHTHQLKRTHISYCTTFTLALQIKQEIFLGPLRPFFF